MCYLKILLYILKFATISTGNCSNVISTTIPHSTPSGMTNQQQDRTTIIIIVASLAGVVTLAVIVDGVFCWKRKHNKALPKAKGIGKL